MDEFDDLVDRYIAVWNETDAAKRQALIARTFTADTHFVDPVQEGSGRDAIDAMVAGVQERFPGYSSAGPARPTGSATASSSAGSWRPRAARCWSRAPTSPPSPTAGSPR